MPFTRISLLKGRSPAHVRAVSESLHQALVEAFEVPHGDRFQAIHQLEKDELIFDSNYQGGPRSDDYVLFAITAGRPRDGATKRRFYRRLVELLAERPGISGEDVMVVITTTHADEWSFAGGRAADDVTWEARNAP